MGFPLVCYCLAVPKPVILFCKLLSAIRDAVLLMLAVVGLCRFPPDGARGSADAHQPEEVKTRLPAVEYGHLLAEQQRRSPASSLQACLVCLEALEATDEVRRLGNCAHAFHRACIDRWALDRPRPGDVPAVPLRPPAAPKGPGRPRPPRAGPPRHPSLSHARLVSEDQRSRMKGSFVFSMARPRATAAVAVAAHRGGAERRGQVSDGDRAARWYNSCARCATSQPRINGHGRLH